jgi:hypothetical protein
MTHVVCGLIGREERERDGDQVADLIEGARPCRAQEGFEFREGKAHRPNQRICARTLQATLPSYWLRRRWECWWTRTA